MTAPRLSYVVQADAWETLSHTIDVLGAQTIASLVELVVVAPGSLGPPPTATARLAGVTIATAPLVPAAAARAVGVEASSADVVAIGETHVLFEPTWAQEVLEAHDAGADVVLPVTANANPRTRLSWAAFLLDYGRYRVAGSARRRIPTYNATFRRTCLMGVGNLERALEPGPYIDTELRARGARVVSGTARLEHLNVDRWLDWVRERYLGGLLVGAARRARWRRGRSALYALAFPAIAITVFARSLRLPRTGVPRATLPSIALACLISAVGEAAGYMGAARDADRRRMVVYELHKRRFLRSDR